MQAPSLTLGVEEEYQIIDPKTRELTSYITQILEADHRLLGQVKPELHQSIVEVGTKVCRSPSEVRAELVSLRGAVIELAAKNGLKIAAAGTHPFSPWHEQLVTPKPRYLELVELMQQTARRLATYYAAAPGARKRSYGAPLRRGARKVVAGSLRRRARPVGMMLDGHVVEMDGATKSR